MLSVLKRLVKGSFVYGVGSIGQRVIGFLLIPVYTRFLSTSDYGIVAVTNVIGSVVAILLGMGLHAAVVRQYYDYEERSNEIREYLGTVVSFSLFAGVIVVGGVTLGGERFFESVFSNVSFSPYIVLTLWTALFGTVGNILLRLYQAREQSFRFVGFQLGRFLVSAVLVIYFVVVLRQGALGKIKGGFYAELFFFLIFMVLMFREATFCLSLSKLLRALKFGIPIVPHMLAGWVLAGADRILLERMTSLSEVGLYNLGYQVGMLMSLVVSAVNFAWVPIFYGTAGKDVDSEDILARMFSVYMIFVATLSVSIVLFSREMILLLAAEPFHGAYRVVPAVTIGYLFQGLYFMSVTPIFYQKKTYVLPFLTGIAATTNVGLNLLWIPKFGMIGAAYATLVSFALLFVVTHYVAQRCYRLPYDYRRMASVGGAVAAVYLLNEVLPFQGVVIPLVVKFGMMLIFWVSMVLLKVVSVRDVGGMKALFGRSAS